MKSKKNIMKEVFIFIVLLILVLLILAVALYDYVPSNVSIAEIKEYSPDSKTTSIKQEIAYTNGGDATADGMTEGELINSLKSYSIDASELAVYAEKKSYERGNSNPFDDYTVETETTTQNNTTTQTNPNQNVGASANTTTTNTSTNNTTNTTTSANTNAPGTTTPATTTESQAQSTTGTFFESPTSK